MKAPRVLSGGSRGRFQGATDPQSFSIAIVALLQLYVPASYLSVL